MGKQDRNFVQQLAHIGFSGLKDSLGQNFNSITSLKSDADTIKSQLVSDGKNAFDVFSRMKNNAGSPAKKLRNWFYANEDSFGGFGDDTEEFDPGITLDSADGNNEDSGPRALTQDDLVDVAKKQTGEQYKIASKQADLHIANTAEIVSALNSRSAEMTAAITKVNDTLGMISKKLDGLITVVDAAEKAKQATSLTDSSGDLSLNGVFDAARQSFIDDKVGTLSMVKDVITGMTPASLASMGFNKLFDHKFGFLGDKSVSNIASSVNEAVNNAVQDGLMSLLKNEKFHDFFDIGNFKYKNKDYQSFVTNTYNTKPAVFDGMTRMSIIHVIPEYLKHIEAALTHGTPKDIDDKGHLTNKVKNYFHDNIKSSVGGTTMDNYDLRNKIRDKIKITIGDDFSTNDMKDVLDALKLGYIAVISMGMPYNSIRSNASAILAPEEIAWGHPTTNQAVNYALRMLLENSSNSNRDANYWAEALQIAVIQLEMNSRDRRKFAAQCTQKAERMAKNSIEFATNHSHKHQAGKIDFNTFLDVFRSIKTDNHKYESSNNTSSIPISSNNTTTTDTNTGGNAPASDQQTSTPDSATTTPQPTPAVTPTPVPVAPTPEASQIGSSSSSAEYTERDYLSGIFGILNRGINVFQVGSSNKQKKKYGPYKLSKGKHTNPGDVTVSSVSDTIESTTNDLLSSITGLNFVDSLGAPIFNANAMNSNGVPDVPEVDEDGNPLSEEEIKRRKAEAKKKEKEAAKENDTRTLSQKADDTLSGLLTGLKEVVPANVKDKLKEHGIGRTDEEIENGVGSESLLGKITGLTSFKELKNSAKEKITGVKDKIFGKVDKAEEKGKELKNKAKDKAEGIASDVQDTVVQNRYIKMGKEKSFDLVNNKLNKLANTAETGVQNAGDDQKAQEAAQHDQLMVQNITAMVQAGGVNGSYSKEEIAGTEKAINSINNKTIRNQMRKFVLPLLRNNQKKDKSDIAYDENNKGPGLLKRLVKYSGLIFKPITKVLGSGLKVLMGMSGVLLKIGGSLIKSGVKDIHYGARSLREGIFGSKTEGDESLGLVKRVLGAPGRMAKAAGQLTGLSYSKIMDKIQTGIGTALNKVVDKMGEKFSGAVSKVGGLFEGLKNSKFGQFVGNAVGKVNSAFGFAGGVARKSDFLRGFFSARDNKRAAKNKQATENLVKATPQNKTEAELDTMNKSMDKSNSFLEKISNFTSDILARLNGKDPEAERKKKAEDAAAAQEKAKQEKEEKRKKAEEDKAKKKEDKERRKAENKARREENKRAKMSEAEREAYDRRKAEQQAKAEKKAAKREARANAQNSLKDKFKNTRLGGALATAHGEGSTRLDIGKTLGGISYILGGIGKIVLGAVTSLAGFKSMMNMITKLLSRSLVPLNKAFNKLSKVLRPVMKNLSNTLTQVAETVSEVAVSLIESLQPIFEDILAPLMTSLGPIFVQIGDLLGNAIAPLLDILVNTLIVPLVADILGVVIPTIQIVADSLQVIVGVLEMGAGLLMWGFGAILSGIGALVSKSLKDSGTNLMNNGSNMITSGWDMAKSGLTGLVSLALSPFSSMFIDEEDKEQEKEDEKEEKKEKDEDDKEKQPQGSILEGYIGNGDVTTNNYYNNTTTTTGHVGDINTNNNTYGNGDSQQSYGNYLGMSKHGCGPIALADAVSRRNGSNLSAGNLARGMSGNGSYSPTRGTSVGSFISTSRALGSNVRAGGVTQSSLRGASSNNPITLLGSGSGFGTRPGNNHYVNVIGGNGRGISYVSNPMTGNIERRSTSDLVSHSVLGIYGSGDDFAMPYPMFNSYGSGDANDDSSGEYYSFPEAVQEALTKLKNLAANFLKIFTGPDEAETAEMELENAKSAREKERALKEAKKTLGDDFAQYEEEARSMAYSDYAEKHPKLDSETDEEYAKKQEKYFMDNQLDYLAKTKVFNEANNRGGNIFKNLIDMGNQGVNAAKDSITSIHSASGSGGGAAVMINTAVSYLGQRGDHFFEAFGKQCDWCAMFISTCGKESGNEGRIPWSASCNEQIAWFKKNNRWLGKTKDIQPGDIIYFDWDLPNPADDPDYFIGKPVDHVGLVYKVDGNKITTIEGNSGSTGSYMTSYVKENTYDMDYVCIEGFARPDYVPAAGGDLPGDTNRAKIWNYLVAPKSIGGAEYTKEGAAGIMGNMSAESMFEPRRENGNYADPISDTSYVTKYDAASKGEFVDDSKAFGLIQWFASRKGGLWDATKGKGLSLGDMRGQLDWLRDETAANYSSLDNDLHATGKYTPETATIDFLDRNEVPSASERAASLNKRIAAANAVYEEFKNLSIPTSLDPETVVVKNYPSVGSGTSTSTGMIINSAADAALVDNSKPIDVGYVVKLANNAVYNSKGKQYDFGKTHYDKKWVVESINKNTGYYTIAEANGGGQKFTGVPRSSLIKVAGSIEASNNIIASLKGDNPYFGSTNSSSSPTISPDNMYGYIGDIEGTVEDPISIGSLMSPEKQDIKFVYDPDYDKKQLANAGIDVENHKWYDIPTKKVASLTGSGDFGIESNVGYSDISTEIPPLDEQVWNSMGMNNGSYSGEPVTYNITRTYDPNADKRIKMILDHTFEVSSKSIEKKLQTIIDKMDRSSNGSSRSTGLSSNVSNQKLFDEHIPSQVSRLSIG